VAQLDTPQLNQLSSVPNLISLGRLLAIPFLVVLIMDDNWVTAALFAAGLGFTDYLDGFIARKWHQQTPLGAVLDPLVDRIFIVAILFAFWWSDLIPFVIFVLIIVRDLSVLLVNIVILRSFRLKVVYLGKMGTWIIFVAFALLLMGQSTESELFENFAMAGILWGVVVYWLAGVVYLNTIMKDRS
jgi:cardiolipin synthase